MNDKYCNRNSFDRIDDDLCEYILSYLPLNDCFVLQCVSQQWKYLIFNKQNKLIIGPKESRRFAVNNLVDLCDDDYYIINESSLEFVLTKCRFLTHLNIDFRIFMDESIIDIFSDNCQHLKSFQVYDEIDEISHVCLKRFASKCGQTLEKIDIGCSYDCFKLLIDLLPNLRAIRFVTLKDMLSGLDSSAPTINSLFITSDNKPVLPKLKEIDLSEFVYLNGFESFVDMYCKQIKRLRVGFDELLMDLYGSSALSYILTQLNRFENIEKLDINFDDYTINESLETDFRLIGMKCLKLIELRIDGFNGRLFECFDENFVLLRKLELTSIAHAFCRDLNISQCFKSCTHLTHLSLRYLNLMDQNFADIDFNLHQIKYVCIGCDNVSQNTFNSFVRKAQQNAKIQFTYSIRIDTHSPIITIKNLPINMCVKVYTYILTP